MLIGLWAIFSWTPTWIQNLISVGDGQKQRGLSMMMLGMGGLTGGFLSGWLTNAIGARRSMLLCFSVCSVLSFVLFKTNSSFSNIIYVEIAVMALFFGVSQGVLSVYIPESISRSIFEEQQPVFVLIPEDWSQLLPYYLLESLYQHWADMAILFLFFHWCL